MKIIKNFPQASRRTRRPHDAGDRVPAMGRGRRPSLVGIASSLSLISHDPREFGVNPQDAEDSVPTHRSPFRPQWQTLRSIVCGIVFASLCIFPATLLFAESKLPFTIVFKGGSQFDRLVQRAAEGNWGVLPIGERVVTVGRALVGTPYQSFTLEIDDQIEAASANLEGVDCWTFFEISLAFARMIAEPREAWTPQNFLHYIEMDRYHGGKCTGSYLSRLHYLEDWAVDNEQRGLVTDITHRLGGVRVRHEANEMTHAWKEYRYLHANPSLLPALARMEARVTTLPMYCIPVHRVAAVEKNLQDGDIICIVSKDVAPFVSTSHVGLATRDANGILHFMHASSPRNFGKVVVDDELSRYLRRYTTDVGIMVVRPLK